MLVWMLYTQELSRSFEGVRVALIRMGMCVTVMYLLFMKCFRENESANADVGEFDIHVCRRG